MSWSAFLNLLKSPISEYLPSDTTSRTLIGSDLSTSVDCKTKEGDAPRQLTSPAYGLTVPASAFKKADLPAPFGPITANTVPFSISISTPVSAMVSPYRTSSPDVEIASCSFMSFLADLS